MGYVKSVDGVDMVDWKKASTIKWATNQPSKNRPDDRNPETACSVEGLDAARSSTSLKIST